MLKNIKRIFPMLLTFLLIFNLDPFDLIMINSIDFSENIEMYNAAKQENENDDEVSDFLIFDDERHTIWIVWYEK